MSGFQVNLALGHRLQSNIWRRGRLLRGKQWCGDLRPRTSAAWQPAWPVAWSGNVPRLLACLPAHTNLQGLVRQLSCGVNRKPAQRLLGTKYHSQAVADSLGSVAQLSDEVLRRYLGVAPRHSLERLLTWLTGTGATRRVAARTLTSSCTSSTSV